MEKRIKEAMNEKILDTGSNLFGYNIEDLEDLRGFENFVYGYTLNNKQYVIRFVHSLHRSYDMVLAEIEFIYYLDKHGASVSKLIPSKFERLVERIPLSDDNYFSVMVFTRAPGTFVKEEELTDEFFYKLGKEIGKLHSLSKTFNPSKRRLHWHQERYIEDNIQFLPEDDDIVISKARNIRSKIQSIPTNRDNYGLIHTDLHFGNMYYDKGNLTFFDWDDSSYKYFVSDIAIILYYYFVFQNRDEKDRIGKTKEIMLPFMKGYNEENNLSPSIWNHLNDFMKLRETILYLVVKADDFGHTNNPRTKAFLAMLRKNIVEDVPFYENLDFINEMI